MADPRKWNKKKKVFIDEHAVPYGAVTSPVSFDRYSNSVVTNGDEELEIKKGVCDCCGKGYGKTKISIWRVHIENKTFYVGCNCLEHLLSDVDYRTHKELAKRFNLQAAWKRHVEKKLEDVFKRAEYFVFCRRLEAIRFSLKGCPDRVFVGGAATIFVNKSKYNDDLYFGYRLLFDECKNKLPRKYYKSLKELQTDLECLIFEDKGKGSIAGQVLDAGDPAVLAHIEANY